MRYSEIDRELLCSLIKKEGKSAQFGYRINRSRTFVDDAVRNGFMQSKTILNIKEKYGVDISLKERPKSAEQKAKSEPAPVQKPIATVGNANIAELVNRVDKIERNVNDIAVTLRLMYDIMQAQERRNKNKPYSR